MTAEQPRQSKDTQGRRTQYGNSGRTQAEDTGAATQAEESTEATTGTRQSSPTDGRRNDRAGIQNRRGSDRGHHRRRCRRTSTEEAAQADRTESLSEKSATTQSLP